eukprot:6814918-Ditylum_brightwellii.AAC.1
MPKRKNEITHESRVDYASSSSADASIPLTSQQHPPMFNFPGSGRATSFTRADPTEIASRRVISSSSDGGRPSSRMKASQDKRRKLYIAEVTKVNKEFAAWAAQQQRRLFDSSAIHSLPTEDDSPKDKALKFFTTQAREYIRLMAEIRARYDRTHGDVLTFGTGDCGQICHGEDLDTSKIPRL